MLITRHGEIFFGLEDVAWLIGLPGHGCPFTNMTFANYSARYERKYDEEFSWTEGKNI